MAALDQSGRALASATGALSPHAARAAQTVRNIEDVKSALDKAGKLEVSNPKGAIDAYNTAAAADKKVGGGLASFIGNKIGGLQAKVGGGSGDPVKDSQADQMLSQARGLASKNPSQAKNLCLKVMQIFGNSAKNPKVQAAFMLLNSIKSKRDDDDEF